MPRSTLGLPARLQVAAAISPLHSTLAAVQARLDELAETKQVCVGGAWDRGSACLPCLLTVLTSPLQVHNKVTLNRHVVWNPPSTHGLYFLQSLTYYPAPAPHPRTKPRL